MTSLNLNARRGVVIPLVACAGIALASCSAGQITQTSSQVASVDGAFAETSDGTVALRDVTVVLGEDGQAALKFAAVNQDIADESHDVESARVAGNDVELDEHTLEPNCSLVANSATGLENSAKASRVGCIDYVTTTVENAGFAPGGTAEVDIVVDGETVTLDAAIIHERPVTGEHTRDDEENTPAHEH